MEGEGRELLTSAAASVRRRPERLKTIRPGNALLLGEASPWTRLPMWRQVSSTVRFRAERIQCLILGKACAIG